MDGNRIFGCFSLLMIIGTIFWVLNDCSDYWERTDDVESTATQVCDSVALDDTNRPIDTIKSVAVKPVFQDSALSPNVVRPSSNESPSASYTPRVGCPTDEYEKGYDDGYEDGDMGLSHSSNYDVSGCFDSDDEVEYEREVTNRVMMMDFMTVIMEIVIGTKEMPTMIVMPTMKIGDRLFLTL